MSSSINLKAGAILRQLEIGSLDVDCFGLVEHWYSEIFGFTPDDRIAGAESSIAFSKAYQKAENWLSLAKPINHATVVMSRDLKTKTIPYGHCGIFYNGWIIHAVDRKMRSNKPSDPQISTRIKEFRIPKVVMENLKGNRC